MKPIKKEIITSNPDDVRAQWLEERLRERGYTCEHLKDLKEELIPLDHKMNGVDHTMNYGRLTDTNDEVIVEWFEHIVQLKSSTNLVTRRGANEPEVKYLAYDDKYSYLAIDINPIIPYSAYRTEITTLDIINGREKTERV